MGAFEITEEADIDVTPPTLAGRVKVFWSTDTQTISVRKPNGDLVVSAVFDGTPLIMDEQGADPGPVADKGKLYTKEVAGLTELFYLDDTGQPVQLTSNGAVNGGGGGGGLVFSAGVYTGAGPHAIAEGEIARWDALGAAPTLQPPAAPTDNAEFGAQSEPFGPTPPTLTIDFNGKMLLGVLPMVAFVGNWAVFPWRFKFSAAADMWIIQNLLEFFYTIGGGNTVTHTDNSGDLAQTTLQLGEILGLHPDGTDIGAHNPSTLDLPWAAPVLDGDATLNALLNRTNKYEDAAVYTALLAPAPNDPGDEFAIHNNFPSPAGAPQPIDAQPTQFIVGPNGGAGASATLNFGAHGYIRWKWDGATWKIISIFNVT